MSDEQQGPPLWGINTEGGPRFFLPRENPPPMSPEPVEVFPTTLTLSLCHQVLSEVLAGEEVPPKKMETARDFAGGAHRLASRGGLLLVLPRDLRDGLLQALGNPNPVKLRDVIRVLLDAMDLNAEVALADIDTDVVELAIWRRP